MNKLTKYLSFSAVTLILLGVGATSNNVNASHYYHNYISRRAKQTYKRSHKMTSRKGQSERKAYRTRKARAKKYRHDSRKVLKPRYQIVPINRRGTRALQKSGFVDGRILTKMGYSPEFYNYIFNKYAPNDKRAKLPNYMNPKAPKMVRHSTNYNDVNKDFWVNGIFNLSNPRKNTKNPKVYKYNQKLRGWQILHG